MTVPASFHTALKALGIAGAVLLQGLLAVDGGLLAILKSIHHARFPWGQPMTLVYTGLPLVDHFANIQVAFWNPVVAASGIPFLQACLLCASLQTAGVWLVIEGLRGDRSSKHWIVKYAALYVFLWQGIGTAIFLPFFFSAELAQHPGHGRVLDPRVPYTKALALLPAVAFSLAHPFILVFLPPSGVTAPQHQTYLAAYQFGPLICYALVTTLSSLLASDDGTVKAQEKKHSDAIWLKATYLVCGSASAAVHVLCLYLVLSRTAPSTLATPSGALSLPLTSDLWALFLPSFSKAWTANGESLMTLASLFFLQWDFIICAAAGVIYVLGLIRAHRPRQGRGWVQRVSTVPGTVAAGAVLSALTVGLGPGFVVSLALFSREDGLRLEFDAQSKLDEGLREKDVVVGRG